MHFWGFAFASYGKVTKSWCEVKKNKLRKLEKTNGMHARGFAESNLQKLTRACWQLLKVTPDHSAPLIDHASSKKYHHLCKPSRVLHAQNQI